jgi:hypothetical protein
MPDVDEPFTCDCGCNRFIALTQFNETTCEVMERDGGRERKVACFHCMTIGIQSIYVAKDFAWVLESRTDVHGQHLRFGERRPYDI